jgi:hypothetical protein
MESSMPKARRKLLKGVHVHESGSVYICYKNEHGKIIRENTHQTDVKAAELMLAQAPHRCGNEEAVHLTQL